ncbi:hypothetical protein [Bradyrhizobium sp. WSM1417]|uniref:hypothetical protein n=1 Tax=Bradyrhizobium sp. WSM1417 TaxID=754500 RepID=UPI00048768A3|nr:hypothetical protein [Bradyrhizobium sp. WSM1417]
MGWKLFAVFAVLLASYGIGDVGTFNAVQTVDFVIEVLAASGLVLMAFEIDFLPGTFWRGFAGAYFAYYSGWFAEKAFLTEGGPASLVIENALTYAVFHIAVGYGLWMNGSIHEQHGAARQTSG